MYTAFSSFNDRQDIITIINQKNKQLIIYSHSFLETVMSLK